MTQSGLIPVVVQVQHETPNAVFELCRDSEAVVGGDELMLLRGHRVVRRRKEHLINGSLAEVGVAVAGRRSHIAVGAGLQVSGHVRRAVGCVLVGAQHVRRLINLTSLVAASDQRRYKSQ